MTARQVVLERIRLALAGDGPTPLVARNYRTGGIFPPGSPALLDRLEDRTLDYRAAFVRATPDTLAARVAAALGDARRVIVPPGLDPSWAGEVIVDDPSFGPLDLDTMDAVITGCALAIAETGTLVLDGSGDQGRRAITLVPDVHVCVVRAEQVVGTVPEGLALLDPRRPLTFISGPSATSDIELARVEGVHGPRRLTVVLVSSS